MELTLDTPVRYIPHIGPVMAGRLANLEIFTLQDMLYHVPFRYDDFSLVSPITRVQPGETVTINATVQSIKNILTRTGKRIQEAKVTDTSGSLTIIWFNQMYILNILAAGDLVHFSGKIDWFGNKLVMSNPSYEKNTTLHTGRLVPIYSETAGVSSKWLRTRIAYLLETMQIVDFLPQEVLLQNALVRLNDALHALHFPKNQKDIEKARRRIAFDEVFLLQLAAYEQKRVWRQTQHAKKIKPTNIPHLPFVLTSDQNQAIAEILSDVQHTIPMNRLLVGDVGSGKTVVAATVMYAAYKSGIQSILMAPTVILAHQHYETISKLLVPLGVTIGLATSEQKSTGDIIIGTHALLTQKIKNVGLVVVDEQHRFGVTQRSQLVHHAHFLTMTATPIPRTIAKTILGNIDVSILTEMPAGRQLVKTWVVPPSKRTAAYEWIKKQEGQTFIICPFIETSEAMSEVKAVKAEYEKIKKIFSHVGLLHGKMTPNEKTSVLSDFRAKKIMVLVSTPVVEVGIDIPDATIMMIEDADRFGLGQLHQLRGRVGRGRLQSYCLLLSENEHSLARLKFLETTHSGPALAQIDLELRGPGEVFGTNQHGMPHLKIARFTDIETIHDVQDAIESLDDALLRDLGKKIIIEQIRKD